MNSNLRHKNTNTNQKTKTQYNSKLLLLNYELKQERKQLKQHRQTGNRKKESSKKLVNSP